MGVSHPPPNNRKLHEWASDETQSEKKGPAVFEKVCVALFQHPPLPAHPPHPPHTQSFCPFRLAFSICCRQQNFCIAGSLKSRQIVVMETGLFFADQCETHKKCKITIRSMLSAFAGIHSSSMAHTASFALLVSGAKKQLYLLMQKAKKHPFDEMLHLHRLLRNTCRCLRHLHESWPGLSCKREF